MKTTLKSATKGLPSVVAASGMAFAMLIPATSVADFRGGDPLTEKSSKWDLFSSSGGGKATFKNSRLEYLVKSSTDEDRSILLWTPNEGAYDQNWFIQVDVHLDMLALPENSYADLNLGVFNTKGDYPGFAIGIQRSASDDSFRSGFATSYIGEGDGDFSKNPAIDGTLRLHFDRAEETITGSWNTGSGWKYSAPRSASKMGITKSGAFTAALAGSSGGHNKSHTGPAIKSGNAYFSNFKTGAAKPDITIEQPMGSDLVDGKVKKSFGSVAIGSEGVSKTFVIKNTGTSNLTGLAITKDGTHAKDYIVSDLGKTTLVPGASTAFKVTFKPSAKGTRSAAIHIKSNDANEVPFDIKLTGMGVAK